MTCYLVRHQRGGYLPGYAFLNEPTELQLAAVRTAVAGLYGDGWVRAVECPLIEDAGLSALQPPPPPMPRVSSGFGVHEFNVTGVGNVQNP